MSEKNVNLALPDLGHMIEGGFFHGVLLIDGKLYGEVTGPAVGCFVKGLAWHPKNKDVPGAISESDGLANTLAMAKAGSPLAEAALACRIGGFSDWYVPARVGALLQQGNLKSLLNEGESFNTDYVHWTSTQFSRNYAWFQLFTNGSTFDIGKSWSGGAARFVRRFPLNS